jgi:hypothetical protein
MVEPKRLVDAGVCCSFSEARRLIEGMPEDRVLSKLQAKEKENWGRKPRRTSGADWKKENRGD